MEPDESHDHDLPLSANYNDVHVAHFILDLVCEMTKKTFDGKITYFLKGTSTNLIYKDTNSLPRLKLDCYKLNVTDCWAIQLFTDRMTDYFDISSATDTNDLKITDLNLKRYWQLYQCLEQEKEKIPLEFQVGKHFLDIQVPFAAQWECVVITVCFKTHPNGPSLMWTKDQDGRGCVFTIGDTFNNRSLFPSQDMPQAMSTWHCCVSLKDPDQLVLMTGDMSPQVLYNKRQEPVFHYYSTYKMPASTFALAVGSWQRHILQHPMSNNNTQDIRRVSRSPQRCQIFYPSCVTSHNLDLLTKYLLHCFDAIALTLEPYPLPRLDVLIAPDCFDSMGLACPNFLILSESVLSGDMSLFYRIAHELCHTWFGILLGQKNWTEEWLTEGVCCYLEDVVHASSMQWGPKETEERNTFKAFLKYRLLKNEIGYIPDSLQMLRPDGEIKKETEQESSYVTNGINSERAHIHYLKGFFLLKLLEETAGRDSFLSALKMFLVDYKGKLFTSQEILEYFFSHCPKLKSSELTVCHLCQTWLDSPGLPPALKTFPYSIETNMLYQEVLSVFEAVKMTSIQRTRKRRHLSTSGQDQLNNHTFATLSPNQIQLLFGLLVESPEIRIPQRVMDLLRTTYSINQTNAEVQHAWCELVIQHRCRKWFDDVDQFLHKHKAMGLYLYGEMMISGLGVLHSMARRCYWESLSSMTRATKQQLQEILAIDDVEEEEEEEEKKANEWNEVEKKEIDKRENNNQETDEQRDIENG